MRRASTLLLIVSGALLVGCGLEEYAQKMQSQKQRLDYFERENEHLDRALSAMEQLQREKSVLNDLYVRPPKGIQPLPDPDYSKMANVVLSKYPSQNDGQAVYLGVARRGDEEYRERVLKELGFDETKTKVTPYATEPGPGGQSMQLYEIKVNDPPRGEKGTYLLYFTEGDRAVVVYHSTSDPATSEQTRKLSLATLRLDEDAVAMRRQ